MIGRVTEGFSEGARVLQAFGLACAEDLVRAVQVTAGSLRCGGKVLAFGNGGSAADAQHLAAELVNRFQIDRPPLAAVALTTDTSALTAIGNDVGFERIFEKQVRALARSGDVAIGITTSGTSSNVCFALEAARGAGCTCLGLTGQEGGRLPALCDLVFRVPSRVTPRIQEAHIAWIHAFCDLLDGILFSGPGESGGGRG